MASRKEFKERLEWSYRFMQEVGLEVPGGGDEGLYRNYGGRDEKWLWGGVSGLWYFVTPDGAVRRWDGILGKANGSVLRVLDRSYWVNVGRLVTPVVPEGMLDD